MAIAPCIIRFTFLSLSYVKGVPIDIAVICDMILLLAHSDLRAKYRKRLGGNMKPKASSRPDFAVTQSI
jgi:hypothetical protein